MKLVHIRRLVCATVIATGCEKSRPAIRSLAYNGWSTSMSVDDARQLARRETGGEMTCGREAVGVAIQCLANSPDLPPARRVHVFFTSDTSKVVSWQTIQVLPATASVDSLRRVFSTAWGPADTSQVQYPGRERDASDGLYLGRWANGGDSARVILFDSDSIKTLAVYVERIGQVKYSRP